MQHLPNRHSLVLFVVFVVVVLLLLLALASRPLAALAQETRATPAFGPDTGAPARPPQGARAPEAAPAAVVLANGQQWERFTLRYIDVRTLAPLFGATVLPTEDQLFGARWLGGAGPDALGAGVSGFFAPPSGAGFLEGPPQPVAGPGFGAPGRLPILADPVTNSLIVDP
jgi:hypothetical protein